MSYTDDWVEEQERKDSRRVDAFLAFGMGAFALLLTVNVLDNFGTLVARLRWGWDGVGAFAILTSPVIFFAKTITIFRNRGRTHG